MPVREPLRSTPFTPPAPSDAALARAAVTLLGGRFSTEVGIDLDGDDAELERWFLAATLFGTRISTATALRTFRVLDGAGVRSVRDAGDRTWDELVELLDRGGYARYDFRTARRLRALAGVLARDHPDGIAPLGRMHRDHVALASTLEQLPGWGPVTVGAFLRELRGVWPGAQLPLDDRVVGAARHLRLADPGRRDSWTVTELGALADAAGLDPRDLEAALVRLSQRHGRHYDRCARRGPFGCDALSDTDGP